MKILHIRIRKLELFFQRSTNQFIYSLSMWRKLCLLLLLGVLFGPVTLLRVCSRFQASPLTEVGPPSLLAQPRLTRLTALDKQVNTGMSSV